MAVGRNDPCPCGSGKKYKNCCLKSDRNKPRPLPPLPPPKPIPRPRDSRPPRPAALPPPPPPPPPRPRTPEEVKWNNYFKTLKGTSGEERLALYRQLLDEPGEVPAEVVFETLAMIHDDLEKKGQRTRFAECIALLRQKHPDIYADSRASYATWLLDDAVTEGRLDGAELLARAVGEAAVKNIDIVNRTLELVAYYGHTALLLEGYRAGWPGVREAQGQIMLGGIDEFGYVGCLCEIFRYLEEHPSPDPNDPSLAESMQFFAGTFRLDLLALVIDDLAGRSPEQWTPQDFPLDSPPRRSRSEGEWYEESDETDDESEEPSEPEEPQRPPNLTRLIFQFIGSCWRSEGIPLPRAWLAARDLQDYLTRRPLGDFDPQPSMLERAMKPGLKLPKPPAPLTTLVPERVTLEVALARKMGPLFPVKYRAAALFELQPAWLRFLEGRGLIDAAAHRRVIESLRELQPAVVRYWHSDKSDPALYRAAAAWPDAPPRPAPTPPE